MFDYASPSMAHKVMAATCKYVEVCGLPATWAENQETYCVLHLPVDSKSHTELSQALAAYRGTGGCDFRYMVFPANFGALELAGHAFERPADFRQVKCTGITLTGATFAAGLILETGPLKTLSLEKAHIADGLTARLKSVERLSLQGVVASGPVEIEIDAGLELPLWGSAFHDSLIIKALELKNLQWTGAVFNGGLSLASVRLRTDHSFNTVNTVFGRALDLRGCEIYGRLDLSEATFLDDVLLDLSGARVRGDLVVIGTRWLPREIRLEGATVDGDVRIKADLSVAAPRLVAREIRPRFQRTADFSNVDLTECLIVGNTLQRMDFSRVVWPMSGGRHLLFDEVELRAARQDLPLDSLREADQVLKQKSQQAGDHLHAGDFHYGELEMRRHERGPLGSLLCLEFIYWLLSGYGTRPGRAFLALLLTTLSAALFYWLAGEASEVLDALRLGVAVSTLQKREAGAVGSWVQVIQTALAAVLIALLVLAVRMRLKR